MARGLIAKKMGMTQLFSADGRMTPVTVLQAKGNCVVQIKSLDKEGYDAIQVGCGPVRPKVLTKGEQGHQKRVGKSFRILREFRDFGSCELGQELDISLFEVGQKIKIIAKSKGKGFQGVMKRHGFSGGRATHGSGFHRAPGSLSASAYPSRVFKGKKLPGRMGSERVTVRNLKIVALDPQENLIFIQGAVPGVCKSYVAMESL